MTYQPIDFGTSRRNDGESFFSAFTKVDAMFAELYASTGSTSHAVTDVASAATCDIGAAVTDRIRITGTTAITSFGSSTNKIRFVHFDAALTLTYNATSLILPDAANKAVEAGDAAIFSSDASGNWRCLSYLGADDDSQELTPFAFGAAGDGTTNDTAALLAAITEAATSGRTLWIPANCNLAITSVSASLTANLTVRCEGTIKNRLGASATTVLVTLTGDGTDRIIWKGGIFDGNGGAHGLFKWDGWDTADVEVDRVTGITCTVSSAATTSALWPNNVTRSRTKWGHAHDLSEGTSTQGSIPRVCSISSTNESHGEIIAGGAETVHGCIVVGDMDGGTVTINCTGLWETLADNGIYNVGDALRVDVYDMTVDGVDEPVVNSGTGTVNLHDPIIRNASNSIGLQNCPALQIFGGDLEFVAGVNPFKTRADNTAAGAFRIYDSKISCRPAARVCDFGSFGTLEEFVDKGNRWIIGYDSAVHSSSTLFGMSPGPRCLVESDSEWVLYDATSNVPNSTTFFLNMPTVTELSYWDSRHINKTGNSTCFLRLSGARQQLFSFKNKFSVANIQSETETNNGGLTSAPPREVWSTAVPSSGYWQRGSIVRNIAPSDPGILGWVCVTAGTPGTWAFLGGAVSDPGADSIRFWDDSAGAETWLSFASNSFAISTTTLGFAADVAIPTVLTVPNSGLHILDTNASHDLIIAPGSNLTADHTLTLTTGDADRTITLSGNPTLSDWFDQSVKAAATPQFAGVTVVGTGGFGTSGTDVVVGHGNTAKIRIDGTDGSLSAGSNDIFESGGSLKISSRSGVSIYIDNDNNATTNTFSIGTNGVDTGLFSVTETGSVICNGAAIATNATDGFLYVPSCAGTPTGTPTGVTGRIPIVVDSTNNKMYFYSNGAWRDAGP